MEAFNVNKATLLRSFCQKTGVQILSRKYQFDNKSVQSFTEDDIVNMYPIVKHINPRATDAYNFYTTGQSKIQQGFLKDGYELITALNLLNNVYGAMHPEIAQVKSLFREEKLSSNRFCVQLRTKCALCSACACWLG